MPCKKACFQRFEEEEDSPDDHEGLESAKQD